MYESPAASRTRFSAGETQRFIANRNKPTRDSKVKTIRALDRGLDVLVHLHQARAASLHDFFLATGLPKAMLTRLIVTLEKRGMVWQRLADDAYVACHTLQPRAPQLSDENTWSRFRRP